MGYFFIKKKNKQKKKKKKEVLYKKDSPVKGELSDNSCLIKTCRTFHIFPIQYYIPFTHNMYINNKHGQSIIKVILFFNFLRMIIDLIEISNDPNYGESA